MLSFLTRHASEVKGWLSGFDRVRFRGTLRWLAHLKGVAGYLSHKSVLLKDFKEHAMSLTWMNIRLQTWTPFTVHGVINGREWLARDLVRRQIPFQRRENCFVDVADVDRAQQLLDGQQRTDWKKLLNRCSASKRPSTRRSR